MIRHILMFLRTSLLIMALIIMASCNGKSVKTGMLIITEAPAGIGSPDYANGLSWRYLPGSRIIAVTPEKPVKKRVVTEKFYSASFPEISYDGRFMIFAGQQNKDDIWQIWEMDLHNLKCRRITSGSENCTDPVYLPGERLAFSKHLVNDTVKSAHCIFTCNSDGSDLRQITFGPGSNFATTILKDGRLVTVSRHTRPEEGHPVLAVMRPDGTKADRFYEGEKGSFLPSSACETTEGRIVFIESDNIGLKGGNLISISYNRPLHTRENLSEGMGGEFSFALPVQEDKYLVSYRASDSDHFGLYEFNPAEKSIGQQLFSDPEFNVIDVVKVSEYERPKKLPSEVDMGVKTGLLLCQDINFLAPSDTEKLSALPRARKIEVLGIDTTYGVVRVEEDGSFYLKVMADTPFRIRTLDEQGNVINGPCSWLWLRPNERRGCVGCHEDPELVPDNKVSFAINKDPVMIPVHVTDIKEKKVELE